MSNQDPFATLLVTVMGHIKFDGYPLRTYSETFVIQHVIGSTEWYIQTSNFRFDN